MYLLRFIDQHFDAILIAVVVCYCLKILISRFVR
jgi:hypothetical protein